MTEHVSERVTHGTVMAGLQGHLEGLHRTVDGELLYKLITRGLRRFEGSNDGPAEAFASFLHMLLERYTNDPESHPGTRVKARLIQQRLVPYLQSPAPAAIVPPASAAPVAEAPIESPPTEASTPTVSAPSEDRLEQLQEQFAQQVTQTLTAETGGALLDAQAALDDDALQAFFDLKQVFLKGLDELIHARAELKRRLDAAGEYMRAVEVDRQRLNTELEQARRQGVADVLTGLPKRDMFVRALEAEVGRVTRYGFPLAVALIDINDFGSFNARYGREAGDAVLRSYTRDILSRFRTYDLVSRYGDDEFIVMFPNTPQDGAERALEKARRLTAESCVNLRSSTAIALPGFSSALTVYMPGEKVPALLERTHAALEQIKRQRPSATVRKMAER